MASPVSTRRAIYTSKSLKSPYLSQAIQVNNLLFVSGNLGWDMNRQGLVPGGAVPETEQLFKNLSAVLEAAGCSPRNVVKVNVYLKDMSDFAAVNEVYLRYFNQEPRPARTAVQVAKLPRGARVEMEATAVVGKIHDVTSRL
ncbi:2-iminobutanoate/2-iminopropanoate deaminase [Aplysia californica]|uniref:2-iminobutanoate/2-iminopropanoate deaminase n=1 Tax=Aplysia californica TaxID=6500 RepID=A0ABM0JQL8_APLCA|nr:2-iminobutanoate/2-iminopropanoate deaminase [Aplysia californica]